MGVGELRNFVGALVGARAQKGVFVTTADFTAGAKELSAQSQKRIVLINGEDLARLMMRHDVGVRVQDPHRHPILIKGIDEDFFDHGQGPIGPSVAAEERHHLAACPRCAPAARV